jgi:GAF domain-containing protein
MQRASADAMVGVASALNRAVDMEGVASAIFDHVATAMGAGTVGLWLTGDDDDVLRLAGHAGYPENTLDDVRVLPLAADLPGPEVVRRRAPLFYESRAERDEAWPALRGLGTGMEAAAVLPLMARGRVVGVLALGFVDAHAFDDDATALLVAVSDQCALALDRALLFDAERSARSTLAFLAESTRVMSAALDPARVVDELVELAVPQLADICIVYIERDGKLRRVAMRARGVPEAKYQLDEAVDVTADTPLAEVFRSGSRAVLHDLSDADIDAAYPGRASATRDFGVRSAIIVPLVARGTTIGAASFVFTDSSRTYDHDLVFAVNGFAARAGMSIDNARRFDDERRTGRVLAQALLPSSLPSVPGYELVARYVPAAGELGGDWYDAHLLGAGALLLGVGDVAGHGIAAAAQMSEVRHVARGLALSRRRPRALITELARFVDEASGAPFVTVGYARVDLDTGAGKWVSAGHPPALLVRDGVPAFLPAPHGPPLGIPSAKAYRDTPFELRGGDLFVAYTDGVIERRDAAIDVGLARLADIVAEHARAPLSTIADVIDDELCSDPQDDCCVLMLRRNP